MQAAADRLASKLDALDLDAEERAVLTAMLGSGAASVETAGDEVEGFALNAYLSLQGQKQGKPPSALDENPQESISFNFGRIQFEYSVQH